LPKFNIKVYYKTRSARNFREGTLEVGKMHFNTPQDRITKEMIMDYQQTQQEKHYDDGTNKLKYEPTGLKDIPNVETLLETYTPINFKPTNTENALHTGPVDEEDLRHDKIKLNDLCNDLQKMQTIELTRRKNLLKRGQKQLLLAKERVQEKIEHMTEVGNKISEHYAKLRGIEDEISVFHSTTSISSSPGAPTVLKRLQKEESEEKSTIKSLEKYLNGSLKTELEDEEKNVIRYEAAVLNLQKQIEDYKTNKITSKREGNRKCKYISYTSTRKFKTKSR
jgi:hypothetical protein